MATRHSSTQLTRKELNTYRRAARRRLQAQRQAMASRRRRAWRFACRAATFLKREYGATRVVVFGSLSHGAWFHPRSDLDLAVEGLKPGAIWRAWSAVEHLIPGFEVDLIELETATDRLRQRIREQGREL
jgi:predicted nucleotidyltransferase